MKSRAILSERELDSVCRQVGVLLPQLEGLQAFVGGTVELGDYFEIWMIEPDYEESSANSLTDLAFPIGLWHHQVRIDSQAIAYAISGPERLVGSEYLNPDHHIVRELILSDLALKIDTATKAILSTSKFYTHTYYETRLLILPNYFLSAFWLVDTRQTATSGQLYIIDYLPEVLHLKRSRGSVELLRESEFLTALLREEPIIGRVSGESYSE
jgi:hypothetical protein